MACSLLLKLKHTSSQTPVLGILIDDHHVDQLMVPDAIACFVLPLKHDYVGHMLIPMIPMIPIPDKSAKIVAYVVVHPVFCRRRIPEYILTDRSCEFYIQALNTIAQELGIVKKRISALHPQANNNAEYPKRNVEEIN